MNRKEISYETYARVFDLATASLSDTIDDEGAKELEKLIVDDEAARRLYIQIIDDSLNLRTWAGQPETSPSDRVEPRPAAEKRSLAELLHSAKTQLLRQKRTLSIAAGLMAIVTILTVAHLTDVRQFFASHPDDADRPQPVSQPEFVARLTNWHSDVWLDSTRPPLRDPRLAVGKRLLLASGFAEITYDTGARVVLEGPAEFTIGTKAQRKDESDQQINSGYLKFGRLVARVEGEDAMGFFIDTPNARVEDLSTEFGVIVARSGNSELHVIDGAVNARVRGTDGQLGQPVLVKQREAVMIAASARRIGQVAYDAKSFTDADSFAALTESHKAALLAYDGIDGYETGVTLIGQRYRGGGFSRNANTWAFSNATKDAIQVVAGGLTYSNLLVSGSQHVRHTAVNGGLIARLDMSRTGHFARYISGRSSLGIDRGTLFYSYIASSTDTGTWTGGTELAGTNPQANTGSRLLVIQDGKVHLFVGKIEFNAGPGREDLWTSWVDPTPGTSEAESARARTNDRVNVTATVARGQSGWFDYMTHIKFRGDDQIDWDELRVGGSFESVTPAIVEIADVAIRQHD